MLLSDRDILAEIDAGRVVVEPYDPAMIQPSSIDFRLDRYFRVFENHRYPHIDPAADQPDLTREVEPDGDEPFILHPGEFVLGLDVRGGDAARRRRRPARGQVVARAGSGCSRTRPPGFIDPGFSGHVTLELANVATLPIKLWPGMKIGQLCFFRLSLAGRAPLRLGEVRLALPGPARPDAVAVASRTSSAPRSDPGRVRRSRPPCPESVL